MAGAGAHSGRTGEAEGGRRVRFEDDAEVRVAARAGREGRLIEVYHHALSALLILSDGTSASCCYGHVLLALELRYKRWVFASASGRVESNRVEKTRIMSIRVGRALGARTRGGRAETGMLRAARAVANSETSSDWRKVKKWDVGCLSACEMRF